MPTTRPPPLRTPTTAITTASPFHPHPRPSHLQIRHATFIPRPHRPYTFTQLLTLSDGSTFLHRTTSPTSVYRSARDTRNSALWNPSNEGLANVEEDEAGRLRAFRRRFGRGWDLGGREGGRERPGAGIGGAVDEEGPGSLRSRGGVVREGEVRGALGMDGDELTSQQPTSAPLTQNQPPGETTTTSWSSSPPSGASSTQNASDKDKNPAAAGIPQESEEMEDENLMDLISSYGGDRGKDGKGKGEGSLKGNVTGKRG